MFHIDYLCKNMKIHTNIDQLPAFKNAVITIGSFDGVHIGHQLILENIKQLAAQNDGESIVITFYPHPRQVLLQADDSFRILTSLTEKQQLLASFGVDHLVVIPFSTTFSEQSPQDYIESFLIKYFKPKCIVIGYDHRFGKDRVGDINYLKEYTQAFDYQVFEIKKQEIDHLTISSTKIRNALEVGDLATAKNLLGYNYKLSGTVQKGDQLGRKIGFPTANIGDIENLKLVPQFGIYAARIFVKNIWYEGMLYIGNRPTVSGAKDLRIEINIFDFEADIYGENVTIEFLERTRSDQKYDGLPALIAALKNDEIETKAVFAKLKKKSIAVVILNYNGRKYLEQFLPTVVKYSANFAEIIIADNASTDDSLVFLNQHYPELGRIVLDKNNGYAGGYNEALKQVKSDYYVLLNSDIEVSENWLQPMIDCLESDEKIAACQPKILSFKDKTRFEHAGASGGMMDMFAYPLCRGRLFYDTESDEGQYDDMASIFWASGAALMIKSDVFHNLGGFDDAHFAHQEEIDLCWRLQRAGFELKVVPQSIIYHVGGGTLDYNSPFKTYLNFRNSLMMILKNETVPNLIWLVPTRLVLDGVAGIMFLMKGQFENIWNVIKAHFWVYFNIISIFKKRNLYQNLVEKHRIHPMNIQGKINKSIVYQYFINKKRKYNEL